MNRDVGGVVLCPIMAASNSQATILCSSSVPQPNFRLLGDLPFWDVPMQLPPVLLTDGSCVAIQTVPNS